MPRPMYSATIVGEALAVTTRYILVDLSDVSGYPHKDNAGLRLYRLTIQVEKQTGTGKWDIKVGIVLECDATNGTVQWFAVLHCEVDDNATDDTNQRQLVLEFAMGDDGYQLMRVVSGVAQRSVSNHLSGDVTWVETDAGNLADATGATNKSAGDGDIVVECEEVSGAATLDVFVEALYSSE